MGRLAAEARPSRGKESSMIIRYVFAAATAALLLVGSASGSTAGVQQVHGHILSQQVTGEGCSSPVGLCTAGRFIGTIKGDFEFFATSIFTSGFSPTVFFYTGEIVAHTNQGDFRCIDTGALDVVSPDGQFVDLCTVASGTGDWAGATGYIQIVGTFTAAEGGNSDYRGKVSRL
jgi:hypothetical protein